MNKSIVITNSFDSTYDSPELVYTWNGYSESSSQKSILKFIEKSGDDLRNRYLKFIHDLGEFEYQNCKIREYLQVNELPSLWWMSLMVEKSPWKSPSIIDSIRAIAIEEIIKNELPKKVLLRVNNKDLARTLEDLCDKLNISFKWQPSKSNFFKNILLLDSTNSFLSKIQGLIYLFYYFISRWTFRKKSYLKQLLDNNSIFFSSYFYNLDLNLAKKGDYFSRQWGGLPGYLNQEGYKTFHLENYLKSPEIYSPNIAKKILNSLNEKKKLNYHAFLDQHLSLKMFFSILLAYFKIIYKSINYRYLKSAFNVESSELNLWPLVKEDWFSSVHGKTTVANLIWIHLFEKHLKEIPFQKVGFYLCENMGWEKALIKAWRNNKHGTLVAVPHSTIRFWDLRYFSHPEINIQSDHYSIPMPDYFALNGEMAWESFIKNKYAESMLLKSEALRYQFIAEYNTKEPINRSARANMNRLKKDILILGDFTEKQTNFMLKEVESVIDEFNFSASYTLKPHPVSTINESQYPSLNLLITRQPLQDIVDDFDIIFASNTTSASLDCFLMGKRVIIFLDGNNLNFSPLRNIDNVSFVSNAKELYTELKSTDSSIKESNNNNFFWVDADMPKWKKIINNLINLQK